MQLIKKIFSAMLILVGILFMLALFGFAIMMIFHVSIFGYTYASQDDKGHVYYYDSNTITSLEIETNSANVVLMKASSESENQVAVRLMQSFQGIVKSDVKKYSYNVPTNAEGTEFSAQPVISGGVLKIVTKDPTGLLFKNDTTVAIAIPQSLSLQDLKVSTASNTIGIGDEHELTVSNFKLINKNKSLLSRISISENLKVQNKFELETSYGRIVINSTILGDVYVTSEGGSIIFNKDIAGNVTIEGDNPYVEFGSVAEKPVNTIENSKVEEYTRQKKMESDPSKINELTNKIQSEQKNVDNAFADIEKVNIKGNLYILDCKDGNVKVGGTITGFVYIQSPNVQFWANNIENGITCDSGSNNIRIFGSLCKTHAGKTCTIKNGDGHLFINHCYANVSVYAEKNGVFIKNAYDNVYVENKNYGTTVNFASSSYGKKIEIHQDKGKIVATNISGPSVLEASSNSVYAEYLGLTGTNKITAKSGATVKVVDGIVYHFVTKGKAKAVKLDVNLGSVKFDNWKDGSYGKEGSYIVKTTEQGIEYTERHENVNADPEELITSPTLKIFVTDSGTIKATAFQITH